MEKEESEQLYKQWYPLVVHIVKKKYMWAISDTGTGSYQKIRRAVSMEDLIQVGWMYLQKAWENYNLKHGSGASFKTYAYTIIYHGILNYIDSNKTPITTYKQWAIESKGTDFAKDQYAAAVGYQCFSEVSQQNSREGVDGMEFIPVQPYDDESAVDPAVRLSNTEFHEKCITKLKDNLTEEEWRILMLRYEGNSLAKIGKKVGLSIEWVRRTLESLNYKVHHILYREIKEFGYGNDCDIGLANQVRKAKPRIQFRDGVACDPADA